MVNAFIVEREKVLMSKLMTKLYYYNSNKLCLQFKCLKKEQGNQLITRK